MSIRVNRCARVGIGGLLLWWGCQPIHAQSARQSDLSEASLERLMNVRSYVRLDARLARRIGESAELSIVGQNLLDDRHFEFATTLQSATPSLARRSIYGKISWRF